MRTHSDDLAEDEAEAYFVSDGPGNGTTVACRSCGEESVVVTGDHDVKCANPKCRKWFVYRPWWEW